MITDMSDDASNWTNSQYNHYWLPTNYFDAGQRVIVGANTEAAFRDSIEFVGSRTVLPLYLELSVEWLGDSRLGIDVKLKQGGACIDTDGDGFGDPGHAENVCPR